VNVLPAARGQRDPGNQGHGGGGVEGSKCLGELPRLRGESGGTD
jgi:hypothetical protein